MRQHYVHEMPSRCMQQCLLEPTESIFSWRGSYADTLVPARASSRKGSWGHITAALQLVESIRIEFPLTIQVQGNINNGIWQFLLSWIVPQLPESSQGSSTFSIQSLSLISCAEAVQLALSFISRGIVLNVGVHFFMHLEEGVSSVSSFATILNLSLHLILNKCLFLWWAFPLNLNLDFFE